MNVASLELCKELYELSGWETDQNELDGKWIDGKWTVTEYPAYSLGYLLRKLPLGSYIATRKKGGATASTGNAHQVIAPWIVYTERGDTAEDAAAKLCIELFKAGVLARQKETS